MATLFSTMSCAFVEAANAAEDPSVASTGSSATRTDHMICMRSRQANWCALRSGETQPSPTTPPLLSYELGKTSTSTGQAVTKLLSLSFLVLRARSTSEHSAAAMLMRGTARPSKPSTAVRP